jgi:hypothetical protein
VLLPATLHAFASDVSSLRPWLGWSWPLLIVAASILLINSLREGPRLALETFRRFVVAQLVEEGRPPDDKPSRWAETARTARGWRDSEAP